MAEVTVRLTRTGSATWDTTTEIRATSVVDGTSIFRLFHADAQASPDIVTAMLRFRITAQFAADLEGSAPDTGIKHRLSYGQIKRAL